MRRPDFSRSPEEAETMTPTRPSWDDYFLGLVREVARWATSRTRPRK